MADKKVQELEKLQQEVERLKSKISEEETGKKPQTLATEVLYRWTVPSRIFRKKDRRWFVSIAFVILVFIILFAFLQDILPILVLVTLMFVLYLLGTVEPSDATHEITNKGIQTMNKLFKWENLKDFWFCRQDEWLKVYSDTSLQFPGRLIMLLKPSDDKKVFNLLKESLPYKEIEKQDWLSRINDGEYIPLEVYMPKMEKSVESTSSEVTV